MLLIFFNTTVNQTSVAALDSCFHVLVSNMCCSIQEERNGAKDLRFLSTRINFIVAWVKEKKLRNIKHSSLILQSFTQTKIKLIVQQNGPFWIFTAIINFTRGWFQEDRF